jgi:hypothetical protein
MWSIAAHVEVLERKGLLTKQEVRETITELRQQTPHALDLLNAHSLTMAAPVHDASDILYPHHTQDLLLLLLLLFSYDTSFSEEGRRTHSLHTDLFTSTYDRRSSAMLSVSGRSSPAASPLTPPQFWY